MKNSPGLKQKKKKKKKKKRESTKKKLWNIEMLVIPVVVGALGTITKGLEQGMEDLEIRGRVETIQTKVLLRSARILRSDGDTNCSWRTRYCHQRTWTRNGRLGNKGTSGDHPNYSIVEIGQNTKKHPRHLRRLAVTQTPIENSQKSKKKKYI